MEYIKKLIETKPFENQSSGFFDSLGANIFLLKKVKTEFAKNAEFATLELRKCSEIIARLNNTGSSPTQLQNNLQNTIPKEQLEEEFKAEAKIFFEQYIKAN